MTKAEITGSLIIFGVVGILFVASQNQGGKPRIPLSSLPTFTPPTATPSVDPVATLTATFTPTPNLEDIPVATSAVITTSKGDITVSLDATKNPKTVRNFLSKAQSGFYTNLVFHRVEDWVIQGGDPKGDGTGGGSMSVELTDTPFITGSLGVASTGDGKTQNDAQFFITKKDADWLNNKYTNFGQVTEGMDVVNQIAIGDKILKITPR